MSNSGGGNYQDNSEDYSVSGFKPQRTDEQPCQQGTSNRPPSKYQIASDFNYFYPPRMPQSLTVSPLDCTCDDSYTFAPQSYPFLQSYDEREYYYANNEPQPYILTSAAPRCRCRRKWRPENLQDLGVNCIGSVISGTSSCLVCILEVFSALMGGICDACKPRRPRRLQGVPYSWKYYDVGNYEYDMVVYRRPRRTWCEKIFNC